MYNNTDNSTYATVTNSQNGTTSYYIYLRGFNFDDIPAGAIINSWTVKLKARESGISTSSSYAPKLCHGTSQITSTCSAVSSTATTHDFTGVSADWEDIVGYGSDFGIRINCRRSNRNTTGYMYIYGAEILVDYTLPIYHFVTIQNSTSVNVSASDTNPLEGTDVTISANALSGITVKDNGVDVTSQFVQAASGTATSYPESYSTSGSISGTHYQQCIGVGVDGSSVSGNDYSSSSGSTAHIDYSFDFSEIPAGASIQSVSVRVKGHCESTSSSSEVATLQLYSGSTAKGSESEFTSTSDQTITMSAGTWTRAELQNAILRFTIGYYGGAVSGATWSVTYEMDGYVYTISNITADHTIVVSPSGGTSINIRVKQNGAWITPSKVYVKQNGTWRQATKIMGKTNGSWN
ncbi:MAG: hypothetical protein J6M55_02450 [Paludibacteraceae bacterium]|nr:hypothetical protein [Paludibacteraceae bacterium]